jgi:hypothetical protein
MSTADSLRQMLKEDKCGKNLYNHLTETLMKILMDKPTNAYDQVDWVTGSSLSLFIYAPNDIQMYCIQFELVSADVKLNPFNPDPVVGRGIVSSAEEVSQDIIDNNRSCMLWDVFSLMDRRQSKSCI